MDDDEALVVYSNKKPLRLKIKPYYRDSKYLAYSKMKPNKMKESNKKDRIEYVDLNNI